MRDTRHHDPDRPTHAEQAADFATENRLYRVLEGTRTRHHREVKRLHREHRQVLAELRDHLRGQPPGGA